MLEETMRRLETAVKSIKSSDGAKKDELLGLLATLRGEVERLSGTHGEHAQSIAAHAANAAHEAARKEKTPGLLEHSIGGLSLSVRGLESSHPELVEAVNGLCTMLARIGI